MCILAHILLYQEEFTFDLLTMLNTPVVRTKKGGDGNLIIFEIELEGKWVNQFIQTIEVLAMAVYVFLGKINMINTVLCI